MLSSKDLKVYLVNILPQATDVKIISAYITESAFKWLNSLITNKCKVTIVARLSTSDLKRGSSDINAIEYALNRGWSINRLPELHAKIYLIDNKALFIGSANFTTNGLKLYGQGNLETSVLLDADRKDRELINTIINKSNNIDYDVLLKMKQYLGELSHSEDERIKDWPENLFYPDLNIWMVDLLWDKPSNLLTDTHDSQLLNIDVNSSVEDISLAFINTKIFKWLCKILSESNDNSLFFGKLTATLQNDLCDDPSPYRKDLKTLVSNLLTYCSKYAPNLIGIERPNYSQRIYLIKSDVKSTTSKLKYELRVKKNKE